jgi:carboxyl-terminal processing protease
MMHENGETPIVKPQKFGLRIVIILILLVSLGFTFLLGYGLGGGDLSINRFREKRESVQNSLPEDLDYASVEQVYDSLRLNYEGELDTEMLLDGLKSGLAEASGDPYTEYLNKEAAKDFDDALSGSFTGIGAELSRDKDVIVIVAPIAGFPAEKAGLRPKDVISKIDGEAAYNLSVSEAVKKIRGPEGTKVNLTIIRDSAQELSFEITRAQITIPSVTSEVLQDNIGYLKISRFGPDTTNLAREAAADLKQRNVRGLIVDLRSNPGGLLDAAVELSSLWLDKGEVVLEEKRGGKTVKTFRATGNPLLGNIPTVVLINEGSASASEITAGALRDHDKAKLVGAKTFGKGSVQQLVEFRDNSVLKVTIARWFTPGGKNIDQEGIEPDQVVERTDEDFEQDRDPQKEAAISELQ